MVSIIYEMTLLYAIQGHVVMFSHYEYHDASEELPAAVITVGDICPFRGELDIAQQPRRRRRYIPLERLYPIKDYRCQPPYAYRQTSTPQNFHAFIPCPITFICRYALMRLHDTHLPLVLETDRLSPLPTQKANNLNRPASLPSMHHAPPRYGTDYLSNQQAWISEMSVGSEFHRVANKD
jgi:hypothetical protein